MYKLNSSTHINRHIIKNSDYVQSFDNIEELFKFMCIDHEVFRNGTHRIRIGGKYGRFIKVKRFKSIINNSNFKNESFVVCRKLGKKTTKHYYCNIKKESQQCN